MFVEEIELSGHILDSLILPKILDEILSRGGNFRILEIQVGKLRTDLTRTRIEVSGPTPEMMDDLIRRLRQHGAEVVKESAVELSPAPADGVFPPDFYVTTNQQTYVRLGEKWIEVRPASMDCGIAVDPDQERATAVKFCEVREGMRIAVGHGGIRVVPWQRPMDRRGVFDFMASNVSSEKPKSAIIRELAQEIRRAKEAGGKILVVAGPAVVHTGAGEHLERMIEQGYVHILFSGNALAAHDIEQALYGTSLGVYVREGSLAENGHENHMRAINAMRAAGGIRRAVECGLLRRGVMQKCVRHGVDIVLAGSIRDDGPLPEVITDVVEAQKAMRARLEGVTVALLMGTMLHSIAVGNLLSASVKSICVDINPAVVTKLADRGTFQALGLVTDIEPFLRELTGFLTEGSKETSTDAGPAPVPA